MSAPFSESNIIVGPAELSLSGVNVGYTQGGVTLRKSEEFFDVEADQLKGVIKKEVTMERMFLTTTMVEATFSNMRKAMQEAAAQEWSGSALGFGSANPVVTEHTLSVTGNGVDGLTRTYTFFRAIAIDEVEHLIGARDAASIVPIGFELLKDPAQGSKFGFVVEV